MTDDDIDDVPSDVEADGGQDADEEPFADASSGDEEIHGYASETPDDAEKPDLGAQDAAEDATVKPDLEEIADDPPTVVTQSPVVKTAARMLTPFVVVFGIYLTLFGTSLPGGAFQGGVVMASAIVLIALSFGFEPTRQWLDGRALAGLFVLGAGLFGGIAFSGIVVGDAMLDLEGYPLSVEDMVKLVEVAIAALVSGVIVGAVIWLASGVGDEPDGGESL
ncbi:pesticidal protein Cry4Aa [Natronolimnobius sp. AArcel1]|uniref:MnhB domain-containing protein n=1 Tax=Natronolimnobius sp. AArcel1 TaxID=1679093 RepID=UPI0013ED3CEC|nr:MnhB domain-containing protein [Natronolimnobius sp. AArcel1]NGM71219.1 pesticidal protein Cry4Aa [Natronolimnobius sp. AArcel1]